MNMPARTLATRTSATVPGARQPTWHALYGYPRQLFALGCFFTIAIFLNILAGVLAACGFRRSDTGYWQGWICALFRFWVAAGRALGVVRAEVHSPQTFEGLRGTIVAANHPSLVDAFLLLSVIPRGVCIMRSNLLRNPALSNLARLAGYIANDRGPALVREGLARIGRGDNLIVFPEGTRSGDARLRPFKRGFALIATRSLVRVQTVIMHRDGPFFSQGVGLMEPVPLPVTISAIPGRVFVPEDGESADAFAGRLECYFREALTSPPPTTNPDHCPESGPAHPPNP
jgi:1-acyl-sn-glycerol-3-phosphate acyltransferase